MPNNFIEEELSKSLPRATPGGDWEADEAFERAGPEEEVELDEDVEEDSDEEEGAEEDLAEAQDPEEDEQELEAAPESDPEDEPAPEVETRANKRIRQLSAQKKAAEDRLASVLSQFEATQRQTLTFQQQQYQAQVQEAQRTAQEQARQRKLQDLQMNGLFDPQSKADQFAMSLHQDFEGQAERLARLENQLQQAEYARQWQEYHAKVDTSLRASLKGYKVEDQDLANFRQQAVAVAVANNLADPSLAVQHVVQPLLKFMPRDRPAPVRAARVLTEAEKDAHRSVATRAPAGTKKKGQRAGASHGQRNLKSALDDIYGEQDWGS